MEPTEAARGIRLAAIRMRDADSIGEATSHACSGVLDRRWLLGEVDRLTRERDNAIELRDALAADYQRDVKP